MKIPAGQKISYDVTFLEMMKRPSFGWPTFDDAHTVQVNEKKECSLKYFLSIYGEVGKKFEWTDQFLNGSDKVLAFLKSQKVKFFELNVNSSVAGFFMLDFREKWVCDLAYFGLIEGYIGKGLGSYMLSYAILTAWERNIKIMSVNYKAIAKKLKFEGRAFINGKYVNAIDGKKFETINPATGEKLCAVAKCNHKDVNLAVKVSRKAFNSGVWSKSSPEHRKEVLLKFAELLRKHGDENSVLECVDTGKLIADCINEVANDAPMHFQWYGELIDKVFGKIGPTEPSITSLIVKEPIGVVAGIVPWNFPLMMAVWKMAPALAAGCSVIIKPAEDTPLTAIRVAQIGKEAGIPDGVLNVLPGYGDVGEALGRHKDVDAVSFTGSTEVGGYFLKYSSESNLKPVALEMGGKSPFIVLEDAKITDDLIDNAINSAFWNGGQNCSANMRQIVHKKVKDEFLDKVIKKVKKLKVGDPLDLKSNMGSMISKGHLQTVDGYIQKGIDEGAKLLSGGVSNNKQKGFYAKPTLFDGLKENMTIAQEEIFGPVLGVLTVKNDEEALKVASNSKYGLHASVFTQDINRAFHLAKSLPCGTVSVNTFSEGDIKTPFGGYKQSGSLSRDQGTEALNSFLQTKTIWISHN